MTKELKETLFRIRKPLLVGGIILAVVAIVLGGSLVNLIHNKNEVRKLTKQSLALDKEYQTLLETEKLLKEENLNYIEKIARIEYNLAKPNEKEYRFDPD